MSTIDKQDSVPCNKQRLLIADDEKVIRTVFSQILSYGLPNCRVDVAVNGDEAVNAFRAGHHGVIIMDLKMPVMDGEQAFFEIKDICKKEGWEMPAIIFCTGYDPSANIQKIVANSRTHYLLHKPVRGNVLLEVLKSRLAIVQGQKIKET